MNHSTWAILTRINLRLVFYSQVIFATGFSIIFMLHVYTGHHYSRWEEHVASRIDRVDWLIFFWSVFSAVIARCQFWHRIVLIVFSFLLYMIISVTAGFVYIRS
jgi:hypothetical protein